MNIQVVNFNLAHYVELLREGTPFAFARYGNGEWGCILRTATMTGTRSQRLNIPALRAGLIRGVTHNGVQDHYYLAMQSRDYLKRVRLLDMIQRWLVNNAPSARWVEGEVFHKASMSGRLAPLVRQLRQMRVIVVGPRYLQALRGRVFDFERFVAVAPRNCFADCKAIRNELFRAPPGVVMAFSAGPTAKVLISELWRVKRKDTWLIDFGSLWDPYCGKNTRRYHKRITKAVQKRNLT